MDNLEPGRSLFLAAGLTWLYDTDQPDGAILQHHGLSNGDQHRGYRFIPQGYGARPVVVVDVIEQEWDGTGDSYRCLNSLGRGEAADLAALIDSFGVPVASRWNGAPGSVTASIGLELPARPSLVAAVSRYRAGCSIHDDVFCDRDGCTWYRDGRQRVVDLRRGP